MSKIIIELDEEQVKEVASNLKNSTATLFKKNGKPAIEIRNVDVLIVTREKQP